MRVSRGAMWTSLFAVMNCWVVGPNLAMLAAAFGLDTICGSLGDRPIEGDVSDKFREAVVPAGGPGKGWGNFDGSIFRKGKAFVGEKVEWGVVWVSQGVDGGIERTEDGALCLNGVGDAAVLPWFSYAASLASSARSVENIMASSIWRLAISNWNSFSIWDAHANCASSSQIFSAATTKSEFASLVYRNYISH